MLCIYKKIRDLQKLCFYPLKAVLLLAKSGDIIG